MGYVHDTHVSYFVPPGMIQKTAGTWTPTVSSNATFDRRSAADAAFTLLAPIQAPSNSVAQKGFYLTSVELIYKIATAAADDFATLQIQKNAYAADGTQTGSAPTVTLDAGHDTAAERLATGAHRAVLTLATPVWIDNDENYVLQAVVDAAATTVFDLMGVVVNGTVRM